MAKGKGGGGDLDIGSLANQQEEMNRVNIFSPYGTQMFGTSQVDDQGNIVFAPSTGDDQRAMQVIETPFQQNQRQSFEDISGVLSDNARQYVRDLPSGMPSLDRVGSGPSMGMVGSGPGFDRIGSGPQLQVGTNGLYMGGLTDLPGVNDFQGARDSLEGAMYQRGLNRISPDFDRRRAQLEQQLADQGLDPAGEAYQQEIEFFERDRGNALNDLALGAVGAGADEQSRMFGLASSARGQQFGERSRLFDTGLQQGQFANQSLQNMFTNELNRTNTNNQWAQSEFDNEMRRVAQNNASLQQMFANELSGAGFNNQTQLTERGTGFNELSALMGSQPSMPLPSFGGPAPIDVMGSAIANANASRSQGSPVLGLVGTLGGAVLSNPGLFASSRTFKTAGAPVSSEEILRKVETLPVERWTYKGEDAGHVGPYAEDFNEAFGTSGDPRFIHTADAFGVLMASVQALAAQNRALAARVAELEG